jgi:hypothetical protein
MESRPPVPLHDRRSIAEFFQQVWSQALVTVTGAEDEAAKLLARVQGMAGWSQDEVKRQVRDYADKLTAKKQEKGAGDYKIGQVVYEGLRLFAVDKKHFSWTASQSRGRGGDGGKKKKRLDLEDTADSIHKIRVADLVVTLNKDDETQEMNVFVAKHRTGRSRVSVGPLPLNFELGRVAPVMFDEEGP